ncbi:hypothetical protein [Vulgatibacter sp.]|uniref:hypothetical protein n=1 Tax=Vulgatibacter sp. TaxID=1971226 RepID=UPI003562E9BF
MHRLLVLLPLAALLAGCPERQEVVDEVGGQPGRIMEKMKGATERAMEQEQERLDQMDE